ncbi:hypothetical protein K523DRAFT_355089 [Schizophyllum commune Tattone D]|nr:hypothetical protein K523DRAFT_355089 [Schizophyllum commune Tattone D]
MHRLDLRELVSACPPTPSQDPPKTPACRSRTSSAQREPVLGHAIVRGQDSLRILCSTMHALSAPRTCTSRRPVKLAFYLRDVLLYVGAAGRTSRGAQHKDHRASPLNPPIDETLICCSKRAQDGWDASYLIDESQVARLTSFEMQPAEWMHGAKLRKWQKDVK